LLGNSARKEIIMDYSYEIADARVRAIGGTSAEHLGSFVTWLGSQQYWGLRRSGTENTVKRLA